MDLTGQAVIITGSSSGIGEALARRLSDLGAGIVVNSARSAVAGQRVADSLPDAVYVQGDISDPATGAALVDEARQRWAGWTAWLTTPASLWTCRCTTSTPCGPSTGTRF